MDNNDQLPTEMEDQVIPASQEEPSQSFSFVSDEEASQLTEPTQAAPQENIQEQAPEQGQYDAYIEEPQQQEQQQYAPEEVDASVVQYLSERLGRELQSIDDLMVPQQERELDERVSAIAEFVQETGRSPQDWFVYQQLNPSEMDDMTAIQVQMASEYANLSQDEISTLMTSKYKLDPNLHSEDEVKLSQLQLKIDSQNARVSIEEIRSKYSTPEVQETTDSQHSFSDQWHSDMRAETEALDAVEFDLGNGKNFTFGLNDAYRSELMEKNTRLDEFFDPYVQQDGNWDYDKLNVHRAVIDNMQTIVQSVYKQGMSDGQRGLVNQAANVNIQSPNQGGQTQEDSLTSQLKQALGGSGGGFGFI